MIKVAHEEYSKDPNRFEKLLIHLFLVRKKCAGSLGTACINAYEDTMFYLDSLRTTLKATIRYVTDTVHYKSGALCVDTMS
uniref:Uncharacterized protein n=1 Tax=Cucumis melo TaxID=3656 RepID=A0A9I9EHN5_CUCME